MKLKIVRLNFTSPLHISSGKPDFYGKSESILHSDTIKSAIFSTALLFENNLDKSFFNSFTVSSSLPFFKDKIFFPVPALPTNILNKKFKINFDCDDEKKSDYDRGKIIKKIKYLEKSLYEKFINGKVINIKIKEKKTDEQQLISGYLMPDFIKTKDFKISKSEGQQRVYVSRISEILASEENQPKYSVPYYVDRIYFHKNAGLYFLLDTTNNHLEIIKKALKLLEDFGFGTDRNVGNGQFKMFIEDIDLDVPIQAEFTTNLALYNPSDEELAKILNKKNNNNEMFYTLIERGGYISNFLDQDFSTQLKNPVLMFGENSIFPFISLKGRSIDVTPKKMNNVHEVWRDGTSIFIPLNI